MAATSENATKFGSDVEFVVTAQQAELGATPREVRRFPTYDAYFGATTTAAVRADSLPAASNADTWMDWLPDGSPVRVTEVGVGPVDVHSAPLR